MAVGWKQCVAWLEEGDWHPAKLGTANNPCVARENMVACDLLYKSSQSVVLWLIFNLFPPPLLVLTWQVFEKSKKKNRQSKIEVLV